MATQGRLTRRQKVTDARIAFCQQIALWRKFLPRGIAPNGDLLDRDAMFVCYSWQEYHADEKLLDIAIESG
jgi:hypothetical protein